MIVYVIKEINENKKYPKISDNFYNPMANCLHGASKKSI